MTIALPPKQEPPKCPGPHCGGNFTASDTNSTIARMVSGYYRTPAPEGEVRERVLDELDKAWLHGQRRTSWRRDESADAIMAALRPTDTRREA